MEEEMIARGLIRAKIRTLKGNEVWRWVKPDNGNIVGVDKEVAAAVKVPVPEVKVVVPEPVVEEPKSIPVFKTHSYPSCCGAVFVERMKNAKTFTDDEWATKYAGSQYKRYCDDYARRAESARSKDDKAYYQQTADRYNLDAFKANETSRLNGYGVTQPKSPGIAVSMTEFPDAKQTPGGIWVRQDRDPVSKADKDHFEPAVVVDFTALIPMCVRDGVKDGPTALGGMKTTAYESDISSYGFTKGKFRLFTGFSPYTYIGIHPCTMVLRLWANIARGGAKPGDHVQFIMNQSQRNSNGYTIPQAFAAAGFREVLRTGNSNHPGESTLYLYERVITEQDVKDATSIILQGFFNGQ